MAGSDRRSARRPGGTVGELRRGKAVALRQRKRRFLAAMETAGRVAEAARAAGVSVRTVARWRSDDEGFRSALGRLDGVLVLEAEEKLRDLLHSADARVALRASCFILERRDRGRWGQRDDVTDGATAAEIAGHLRQLQLDVIASVPAGPPDLPLGPDDDGAPVQTSAGESR